MMNHKEFENLKELFQRHVEPALINSKDSIDKIMDKNVEIKNNIQLLKEEYRLSKLINDELASTESQDEVDTISAEIKKIEKFNAPHEILNISIINDSLEDDLSRVQVVSTGYSKPMALNFDDEAEFQKNFRLGLSA